MKLKLGVMGSSGGAIAPELLEQAYVLGRAAAQRDLVVITGACPGVPLAAARGAKDVGGLVVGISPALSEREHVHRYRSPLEYHDVIIYTGSGLMGREIENIRSSDMVVILGGRSGTLGEFAIAFDEAKLIGGLRGSGGIADELESLVRICNKQTGAHVLMDDDPVRLIGRLVDGYVTHHRIRPDVFAEDVVAGL